PEVHHHDVSAAKRDEAVLREHHTALHLARRWIAGDRRRRLAGERNWNRLEWLEVGPHWDVGAGAGDPGGGGPRLDVLDGGPATKLVEPADALARDRVEALLFRGHEPELVADLQLPVRPAVDVEQVVGDVVDLLREAFRSVDLRREGLAERSEV